MQYITITDKKSSENIYMTTRERTTSSTHSPPLLCRLLFLSTATLLGLCFYQTACASDIKSRAAIVTDWQTGRILYAKNPTLRLMPASTVKLMTAILATQNTRPSETVTIGKTAASTPKVTMGLNENDTLTVETLLGAILMASANDAAVALAEAVAGSEKGFVDLMNTKAADMGLADTRFINSNGLPGPGQYTTAKDLAEITREATKNPAIKSLLATREAMFFTQGGKTITMKSTNHMLQAGDPIMFGKTGYTRAARHCFAGIREIGHDTAIVVVLLGVPTRELLWKEAAYLAEFGYKVSNDMQEPLIYTEPTFVNKVKKASKPGRKHHSPKRTNKHHPPPIKLASQAEGRGTSR